MAAPLGLMGGTFDPIHFGHLRLAEEALEHLGLESIRWIPAGNPGHRGAAAAAPKHRLAMVQRAIADNSRFALDDAEALASAPQFTIDTLRRLRHELGAAVPLVFIIGADQLHRLETWRSWRELFAATHLAVGARPGYSLAHAALPDAVAQECAHRRASADALRTAPAGLVATFPMTMLAISGSDIRQRLANGASVRYLMPRGVREYIAANDLYREPPTTSAPPG